MMSVNKFHLLGNLGADPEEIPQGAKMRVAATDRWTDKEGNTQERTEWFTVLAFDKLADICLQIGTKGRQASIYGAFRSRKYVGADDIERTSWAVIASEVIFLGPKPQDARPKHQDIEGWDAFKGRDL